MADSVASPLEVIERSVQARAKHQDLEIGLGIAPALRDMVDEAVAEWARDYHHGLRDHPLSDPELIADRALRNLIGYGPLDPLLADEDVWEIMINGPTGICAEYNYTAGGASQLVRDASSIATSDASDGAIVTEKPSHVIAPQSHSSAS